MSINNYYYYDDDDDDIDVHDFSRTLREDLRADSDGLSRRGRKWCHPPVIKLIQDALARILQWLWGSTFMPNMIDSTDFESDYLTISSVLFVRRNADLLCRLFRRRYDHRRERCVVVNEDSYSSSVPTSTLSIYQMQRLMRKYSTKHAPWNHTRYFYFSGIPFLTDFDVTNVTHHLWRYTFDPNKNSLLPFGVCESEVYDW